MDARQRSATRASSLPQRADVEPQSMHTEIAHMSVEEAQQVVATLYARQGELEQQNATLHQAQRALEAARDKYLGLYDGAPVGYLTLDADGAILEANQTATTLLGVPRAHLLCMPLVRFVAPADQETFLLHHPRLLATRTPQTSQVSICRQDGTSCQVVVKSILVQEGEGAGVHWHIALLDRTNSLHAEALYQQPSQAFNAPPQEEAVVLPGPESQALLGRLASTLAHEVRNPCNAVFLHTDLLIEDLQQLPPGHRVQMVESLAEIKSEVTRLHDMVQDYLTLARLADLQYQPEELGVLVEDVGLEMREPLASRGLTLRFEGLEHLGHVALHRTTLRRALSTLVRQAVGAMPAGGNLTIRGRQEGPKVHLEVCNSGPGLPEEELPMVFEPWHALYAEDTGLELYVARAIVVAHGGTLTVQSTSTRGHGTTFTMILPRAGGT